MKMICPHCGLKGTAKETLLGKKVRCPECQKVFKVTEDVAMVTPTDQNLDAASDTTEQVVETADQGANRNVEQEAPPNVDDTTPQPEIELPKGIEVCSKCGFTLSEKYFREVGSEAVCSICAG